MLPNNVIHSVHGKLGDDSPPVDITALIAAACRHNGAGGIVFHFHGGLVNHAAGLAIANNLYPRYQEAGAFPVFFVWDSGLLETIKNNAGDIAREKLFGLLWKRIGATVARKYAQSEGSRGIQLLPQVNTDGMWRDIDTALAVGNVASLSMVEPVLVDGISPLSDFERKSVEAELALDSELIQAINEVSNGLLTPAEIDANLGIRGVTRVMGSTATLMDPRALRTYLERPTPDARGILMPWTFIVGIVKVAARVIARKVQGRDHGLHATVVEEILREFYIGNIGGMVWSEMKDDTRACFEDGPETYAGTAVLAALKQQVDVGHSPKITLVGHSTGSVFIAYFLEKAAQMLPTGMKFDVIFEAPAILSELMATTLNQHGGLIRDFRMFTMNDDYETRDVLIPVLYPHSLLYFISGVLEESADIPLAGLERFYDAKHYPASDFPSAQALRDFIGRQKHGAVWSVATGTSGQEATAQHHGDCDDDPKIVASLQHLLQRGF